jgi:putative membrane protein
MMGGFGMGGFGLIFLLLIVGLVVWALVRVLPNQGGGNGGPPSDQSSAEDILKERFAKGQIDAEEYESSLTTLRGEQSRRSS